MLANNQRFVALRRAAGDLHVTLKCALRDPWFWLALAWTLIVGNLLSALLRFYRVVLP